MDGPGSRYRMASVSIHAPARGRRSTCRGCPRQGCFDPRPREGATASRPGRPARPPVSIHAPARGRRHFACRVTIRCGFRSTPPRGGDIRVGRHRVIGVKFRSTPPRGGDRRRAPRHGRARVSIHAPARGRRRACMDQTGMGEFRSTPPRGGDGGRRQVRRDLGVSIHAPARGRPSAEPAEPPRPARFRSTPPRGGDSRSRACGGSRRSFDPRPREGATWHLDAHGAIGEFRSTPPRGGDPRRGSPGCGSARFDPRPREGATTGHSVADRKAIVSIHAPARGRLAAADARPWRRMFRSTPPRGGDANIPSRWSTTFGFDPRPREGAT